MNTDDEQVSAKLRVRATKEEQDKLTDNVFRFILSYDEQNGYSPSQREIAKACHISTSTVVRYLDQLVMQRRISRDLAVARSIKILRKP